MAKQDPPKDKRTKPIEGYEGLYSISTNGDVTSHARLVVRSSGNNYYIREKILSPCINSKNGYHSVQLQHEGNTSRHYVHRLVASAFLNNPKNLDTVDHKDFNKSNNDISNLEWVTMKENYKRFIRTGRQFTKGKLVMNFINGVFYKSISEASRHYNFDRRHLSQMLNGEITNKSNLILV